MKKVLILLLAVMMCFSVVSCGGELENLVVGGETVAALEFLSAHLREYVNSDAFLAREKIFEESFDCEARAFSVTRVIEVVAEDIGENQLSVHFLAVKADCDWGKEIGDCYNSILLVVDYETGEVYDEFTLDPSWFAMDGTKEQQIAYMLNGALVGDGYKGGTVLVKSEERTELSKKDIAALNEAIHAEDGSTNPDADGSV